MITKKQWSAFVTKVGILRAKGFDLYIRDAKVIAIDNIAGHEPSIWTSHFERDERGMFIRIKYTYEQSVQPYMNLDDLYKKVVVRTVTMADVYRRDLREIAESVAALQREIDKS